MRRWGFQKQNILNESDLAILCAHPSRAPTLFSVTLESRCQGKSKLHISYTHTQTKVRTNIDRQAKAEFQVQRKQEQIKKKKIATTTMAYVVV